MNILNFVIVGSFMVVAMIQASKVLSHTNCRNTMFYGSLNNQLDKYLTRSIDITNLDAKCLYKTLETKSGLRSISPFNLQVLNIKIDMPEGKVHNE